MAWYQVKGNDTDTVISTHASIFGQRSELFLL